MFNWVKKFTPRYWYDLGYDHGATDAQLMATEGYRRSLEGIQKSYRKDADEADKCYAKKLAEIEANYQGMTQSAHAAGMIKGAWEERKRWTFDRPSVQYDFPKPGELIKEVVVHGIRSARLVPLQIALQIDQAAVEVLGRDASIKRLEDDCARAISKEIVKQGLFKQHTEPRFEANALRYYMTVLVAKED